MTTVSNEEGSHILHRVVCLEVGRLVGDHGITDAVGFIKGVSGERFYEIEDLLSYFTGEALLLRPFKKAHSLSPHYVRDLLPHCFADYISLSQGITGKGLHNEKNLILIDNDAVGFLQYSCQSRMGVGDRFQPLFGSNKSRYMLFWSRAIKRYHSGNITEVSRLQFLQVTPHSRPFQLEDTAGLPRGKQGKGFGIIQGKVCQVKIDVSTLSYDLLRPTQRRQVSQPQQVQLEQANFGDIIHAELGHCHALSPTLARLLKGHILDQRLPGDNHPGSMSAGMTGDPFNFHG